MGMKRVRMRGPVTGMPPTEDSGQRVMGAVTVKVVGRKGMGIAPRGPT